MTLSKDVFLTKAVSAVMAADSEKIKNTAIYLSQRISVPWR